MTLMTRRKIQWMMTKAKSWRKGLRGKVVSMWLEFRGRMK
jgi:hypothetical protein